MRSSVANVSHATAVASLYHIPLKTKAHHVGAFTAQELYDLLTSGFAYVFTDDDATKGFGLRQIARTQGTALGIVIAAIVLLHRSPAVDQALEWLGLSKNDTTSYGTKMIERLCASGKGVLEVAGIIIPTAGAAVTNLATGVCVQVSLVHLQT